MKHLHPMYIEPSLAEANLWQVKIVELGYFQYRTWKCFANDLNPAMLLGSKGVTVPVLRRVCIKQIFLSHVKISTMRWKQFWGTAAGMLNSTIISVFPPLKQERLKAIRKTIKAKKQILLYYTVSKHWLLTNNADPKGRFPCNGHEQTRNRCQGGQCRHCKAAAQDLEALLGNIHLVLEELALARAALWGSVRDWTLGVDSDSLGGTLCWCLAIPLLFTTSAVLHYWRKGSLMRKSAHFQRAETVCDSLVTLLCKMAQPFGFF